MSQSPTKSSIQQDILLLLAAEHRSIEQLIDALETPENPTAVETNFKALYRLLTLHHYGETLVFYPAMREYEKTAIFLETAAAEHASVLILLEQIRQLLPKKLAFRAKLDELKEAVMGHIDEEENEIFAVVRSCMDEQKLRQLAQEFKNIQTKTASNLEARMQDVVFKRWFQG